MQMFSLKNIAGVFIAALIFTAIFIGIMVMQHTPAPEGNLPQTIPEAEEVLGDMKTPDQRMAEELEKLVPEGADHALFPEESDALSTPQLDEPDTQLNNPPSADSAEVPVRFEINPATLKPTLIKATLNFDNEDDPSRPKPEKEDPGDPTSKGDGTHGSHKKGGSKVVRFNSIPIIKMGENFESGLKVITPPQAQS